MMNDADTAARPLLFNSVRSFAIRGPETLPVVGHPAISPATRLYRLAATDTHPLHPDKKH